VIEATCEVLRSGFGRRHSDRCQVDVDLVAGADEEAEWTMKEKHRGAFLTCDDVLI
jgi:hypothetical protein